MAYSNLLLLVPTCSAFEVSLPGTLYSAKAVQVFIRAYTTSCKSHWTDISRLVELVTE